MSKDIFGDIRAHLVEDAIARGVDLSDTSIAPWLREAVDLARNGKVVDSGTIRRIDEANSIPDNTLHSSANEH